MPTLVNAPVVTYLAGMIATLSVLAVLRLPPAKRPTLIDVSARNVTVMNLGTRLAHYFDTGTDDGRHGNQYWMAASFSLYSTTDGHVMICVFSDRQWSDLLGVIGRSDLRGDPRFSENRMPGSASLTRSTVCCPNGRPHTPSTRWSARSGAADVPAGPVHSPTQVMVDPVLRQRGVVAGEGGTLAYRIPNPTIRSRSASAGLSSTALS